ncbi:MAG TPA: aminomethyltransferase family protein [Steroidobacteraceae bacterium]|nr:aminomethyltransferase family protein [Steroidobacteraceae bacterium]
MTAAGPHVDNIPRASRPTPFHASTSALNQTTWWYGWGRYILPDVYSSMPEEMRAIRNAAAAIDMSPLPKVQLSGPDSLRLADRLVTRDLTKLAVDQVYYTPWCNDEGHLIGDGLVFRVSDDNLIISGELSLPWIRRQALGMDVEIVDLIDRLGVLSLQGPKSPAVLGIASGEDWSDLGFSRIRHARIAGADVMVARQGFTGERGYEIWVQREDGTRIWNTVMDAGQDSGIRAAGEYAVDIARIEAGLLLVSADYTGATWDDRCANVTVDPVNLATPYEVGLGRFIDLDKVDFCGRAALQAVHQGALTSRRFVGLAVAADQVAGLLQQQGRAPNVSPRVRWDAMPVRRNGIVVGRATSMTWSPELRRIIGFGCLSNEVDRGSELQIDWSDEWSTPLGAVSAQVVDTPFVKLRRSTEKSRRD